MYLLAPAEARVLVPGLRTDDLLGCTYCPTDGYADPHTVCTAYVQRARELGARVYVGEAATQIEVQGGRVRAVRTPARRVETRVVVDAAGPWAAEVAGLAGVALPIRPYRRQVFATGPFAELPPGTPMTIDFAPSFYFRPEGRGFLLGMTDKQEPPSFRTDVDWDFLARVVERAVDRVPAFGRATVARGWAGLYDTTPDANPILGPVPEVEGFLVAAGFSGHGFMHSPAVGLVLAELILEGKTRTVDLAPLGISRFDASATGERNVI